jgi:hypothetical protein
MREYTLKRRLRKISSDNPYKDVAKPGVMLKERLSDILVAPSVLNPVLQAGSVFQPLAWKYPIGVDKEYSAGSLIPMYQQMREESRHSKVDSKVSGGENKRKSRISEVLGNITSPLATSLLGAVLSPVILKLLYGGRFSTHDIMEAAKYGALFGGAGGLGANLLGGWAGLARKARTKDEHKEYLKESVLKNYLIPGVAGYNIGRRDKMALYDNI